jgi:RHS repeat-associated protein
MKRIPTPFNFLYYQHDANFNVTATTNTSGVVQQRFVYSPYGVQTALSSAWAVGGVNSVYGFQGGRLDVATGLNHFGARDYNCNMGTWIEQDPAGYVDGSNRFQFASSSPSDRVDPSGLNPLFPVGPLIFTPKVNRDKTGRAGAPVEMDSQGALIANHWFGGSGTELDLCDDSWQDYMRKSERLQGEAQAELNKDALAKANASISGSQNVDLEFHGEVGQPEGGYYNGYDLLHGSKGVVTRGPWKGENLHDVTMKGTATVKDQGDGTFVITYHLTNVWNDIVDPNPKYANDTWLASVCHKFMSPKDYKLKITWVSEATVIVRPSANTVKGSGWPYDSNAAPPPPPPPPKAADDFQPKYPRDRFEGAYPY